MDLRERDEGFALTWTSGSARYFIAIDQHAGVVRAGHFAGSSTAPRWEYDSIPTALGTDAIESLLDDQRSFLR